MVKESRAGIPFAWDLRNSPQVGPDRRGAGPRPFERRSVRILVASDPDAELGELAPDPDAPPPGVFPSHPQDELSNLVGDRWPAPFRPAQVGPLPSHELPVPANKRLRANEEG